MTPIRQQLLIEIESTPDPVLEEVLDFLLFTKNRHRVHPSTPHQPIWEFAQDLISDLTPQEIEALPSDASLNHDHYLYGAPKVEE